MLAVLAGGRRARDGEQRELGLRVGVGLGVGVGVGSGVGSGVGVGVGVGVGAGVGVGNLRLLEDEDGGGLLLVQEYRIVLSVAVGGGLEGEELGVGE